jgi:DNA-binding response OmpR family regulator
MMRVLIVEDDRDTQEGIQYLLDSPVLETISARNGLEALDILRRSDLPIDLIVLDLMLPRLSGWELLIELRSQHPRAQVPVIILSALAAPTQHMGAQAYLQKPFDPAMFIGTVERLLGIQGASSWQAPLTATPSSAPSWKGLGSLTTHVLIVDDDSAIRSAVSDLLRDYRRLDVPLPR